MGYRLSRIFFVLLALNFMFSSCLLICQVNSGGLSGVVSDETGGVLTNVEIVIRNQDTNGSRTIHSDEAGRYYVPHLAPGIYQISAAHKGFQSLVLKDIAVSVGQEAVVNLTLQVGGIAIETIVVGGSDLVETRDAAVSGLMSKEFIRELPLNGRDVNQLALLEPGVVMSRRTADSGGTGTKLIAGGGRPSQNSFMLDGSDINDASNATPGSASGGMLGVDTLREFRVLSNSYSAAYGRAAGAVISAVTKSGTNHLHGSMFEFLRNSALDAKNFFDSHTSPIPPFKRNQFGVEVDGPIFRDRTFFMGSYEGLRQRLGVTSITVVPDANARLGILPNQTSVTVNPAVPGYLELVPLPNGPRFNDGTGQFINASSQRVDENFGAARIDHRLTDKTFLFARYNYDGARSAVPDSLNLSTANARSRNQYLTTEVTHTFNERLMNNARFSVNKSLTENAPSYQRSIDPALSFLPGVPLGQISITGLFSLGPSRFGPSFLNMKLFHFSDSVSYTRGAHSLDFGGDIRFYHLPAQQVQSPYGFYQFSSLANFLQAKPSSVEMTLPSSQLVRNWRQSMIDGYVQDSIKLTRRLTADIGVRYEGTSEPEEKDGLLANLRDLHDPQATVGRLYVNPSKGGFAPRAGVAWDPFGDGKTSIRSGFGLFFGQLWSDFFYNAGNRQPPFYTLGSISSPVFPNAYSLIDSPRFVLGRQDVIQYKPNRPYIMQFNLTAQRQITSASVLTVGYAGSRGIHLPRLIDGNQALPTILSDGRYYFAPNSPVQNPKFTGIRYKETSGQSYYNALLVSIEQRMVKGLQLRLNYTYSKSIDTGTVEITQGTDNDLPQNPYNSRAERGLSNYDVRNYFVVYWTWTLPRMPGPRWLGSGWQWNSITTLASGNPYSAVVSFDRAGAKFQSGTSPQRPDLVPGGNLNPVLGDPSRYFDSSAFRLPPAGYYGNLARNTLTGPGLYKTDLSVNKQFRISDKVGMQVRWEAFNIFNHPNFSIPSQRAVFSGVNPATGEGIPVASAGLITTTQTSSRQLQVGLRVTF